MRVISAMTGNPLLLPKNEQALTNPNQSEKAR